MKNGMRKSIAGKLVTSFIAMGVMIIVLCLLTLNGAGLVFRLSGITAAVITGAVILLCLAILI